MASESCRTFLHSWKTLVEKDSPISTQPGPEQSCNYESAFVAHLARNHRNSKSIGTTNFSWTPLRTRRQSIALIKSLVATLEQKKLDLQGGSPPQKSHQHRRKLHQSPCAHK